VRLASFFIGNFTTADLFYFLTITADDYMGFISLRRTFGFVRLWDRRQKTEYRGIKDEQKRCDKHSFG
jgi:hypothetical protein